MSALVTFRVLGHARGDSETLRESLQALQESARICQVCQRPGMIPTGGVTMLCPFCNARLKYNIDCNNCGAQSCSKRDCDLMLRYAKGEVCAGCDKVYCWDHHMPEKHSCPSLRGCRFIFEVPLNVLAWFFDRKWSNVNDAVERGLTETERSWYERDEEFGLKDIVGMDDSSLLDDYSGDIRFKPQELEEYGAHLPAGVTPNDLKAERFRLGRHTQMAFEPVFVVAPKGTFCVMNEVECLVLKSFVHGGILAWFKMDDEDRGNWYFPIEPFYAYKQSVPLEILACWRNGSMESEDVRLISLGERKAEYEVPNWDSSLWMSRTLMRFIRDDGLKKLEKWGSIDRELLSFIESKMDGMGQEKDAKEVSDVLLEEKIAKKFELSRKDARYALRLKELGNQPRSYRQWGERLRLTKSGAFRVLERLEKKKVIEVRVANRGVALNVNF